MTDINNDDDDDVYKNGVIVINNNNNKQQQQGQITIIDLTDDDNYGIDTESDTDIDYDSGVMVKTGKRKFTSGSNNTIDDNIINFQDSESETTSSINKRCNRKKSKHNLNIQIECDEHDTDTDTDTDINYHIIKNQKSTLLDIDDNVSVLNSDSETDTSFVFYEKILKSTDYDLNGNDIDDKDKTEGSTITTPPNNENVEQKINDLTDLGANDENLEEIDRSECNHHDFEPTRIVQPTTTYSTQLSANSQSSALYDNLLQTSQTSVSSVSFITTQSQSKSEKSQKPSIRPNTTSISYNSLAFKSKIKLPFNQPKIRIGLSKRTKLQSLHPKFNKQ
ncbi:hypothetical protein B5S31_g665 [[Candida] boidinii]|nr:hypothetical protein B5S31_g665 [[Candida] boidinii]GME70558.1 unnamed protein product [[Candida] boidinii]